MKQKLFCIILLLCAGNFNLKSQILINEFLASNVATNTDPENNQYADWIELYNSSSSSIDVSSWYLSDNSSALPTWTFPSGTKINAKSFLLIWADGTNVKLHTDFKLSASGEEVVLYDVNKKIIDQISFSAQLPDVSYGRKTDGGADWGFFNKPTPAASNNNAPYFKNYIEQVPIFSISGGFYTASVEVNIQDLYKKGTVRYTVDGSEPMETSTTFTKPIQISQTTVVKARMFYPEQLPGPVVTNTYFINEHFEQRKLPVISLSTHPDYFYAKDSGLYVQTFKPTWEYPIHLEFYQADGLLGFHHDAGVQIGGLNAWILPQKLLNIYSRKKYGSGSFTFQLFPHNKRNTFSDFPLRCSGNDWSNTFFRDGMMQSLIKDYADLDGQDFRPTILFFDGKYLGLQNIREKQDAEYCAYYHHIDPDSLDYIENNTEINEGNLVAYNEMVAKLNAGISSDAAFNDFDKIADTKNYTDYIISQIFSANTSWGHNISCFRKRAFDGRWRWLLHDYDRGFDIANVNSIGMAWATALNGSPGTNPAWATLFLRKMLENDKFKQNFIDRFAEHLYITYNPVTINKKVDYHKNLIQQEMPYQIARWKGTTSSYGNAIPSYTFWENEVEQLKTYGNNRNTFMWDDLNSFFQLNGYSKLQLLVSDKQHGAIKFHDILVPQYPWSGNYFRNRNITLTAEAKPGFKFVGWEKLNLTNSILIASKSKWKYRDASTAPSADWYKPTFDDASWSSGNAEFGYGDNDETTVLNYGTDANKKIPSYYFRTNFTIADLSKVNQLNLMARIDDGAVFYLNGKEIARYNMAAYPTVIGFDSLALTSISGANESSWNNINVDKTNLLSGNNVLAVEIHQNAVNSSDVTFDAELSVDLEQSVGIISTTNIYTFKLDDKPTSLRAVFESDGTCGFLPDSILEPTFLTRDCSPYYANDNLFVKQGVTLLVESGVEILFPKGKSMYVQGKLKFLGQFDKPIILASQHDNELWGGIYFFNNNDTSYLNFVTFINASAGIDRVYFPAAISVYHSHLNLDHIVMREVKDNPIFSRFSDVRLTNSQIKSLVTGDCINIKQGYGYVENCMFEGGYQADMDAIDFDGVKNGIVRDNIIHDFRGDNNDGLDIGEQCENLMIENNFIYHCFDKGISVGQQSTANIKNNTIAYTAIGIALKDQSPANIDHCTFFGNQAGISAYEKNSGYLGGNGIITNCIVSNAATDAYVADEYSSLQLTNCLSDMDSSSLSQGTIIADPKFEMPTFYNFYLKNNSPAKNKASDGFNLGSLVLPLETIAPRIMISEILYDDSLSHYLEFIEVYNPGSKAVDISKYVFSDAIDFEFPAGTILQAHEAVVITKDKSKFVNVNFQVFEWTDGKLRNEGEQINLYDADGLLIDFVKYNNKSPWPKAELLLGRSIEIIDDKLDNHFASSWKSSSDVNGTPGKVDFSTKQNNVQAGQFKIYPNPTKDFIHIDLSNINDAMSIDIINEFGISVYSNSITSKKIDIKVDKGYYVARVNIQNGAPMYEKIIVE